MATCPDVPGVPGWDQPENQLMLMVFDPALNQYRPLRWGEAIPGMDCAAAFCQSEIPSSKQMQDAYFALYTRLKALEEKYCECVCGDTPEPTLTPTPTPTPTPTTPPANEPDSWQSNIVVLEVPEEA